MDLSKWDGSQVIALNGDWEFYWHKFYDYQDFHNGEYLSNKMYVPVPEIFNNIIPGNNGVGYATYRLKVILPESNQNYAFYIHRMPTSYRLYFNNKMIHSVGIAGTNKSSSYPVYSSEKINIQNVKSTNEIIFQSANYWDRAGGIWKKVQFGHEEKISKLKSTNEQINMGFLVLFLFLFIYHLVQFLSGIKRLPTLVLSILSLILAIRVSVMDELLILQLFPRLYSRDMMRIEFMTFFSIIPVIHFFLWILYKEIMSKTLMKIHFVLSGLLDLITLLTPTLFYVNFMDPYKLVIFISLAYLIVVTIKGVKRKIPGAILSLTGLVLFALAAGTDIIIFTLSYDSHLSLTPYGFLAIVFFESITIFRQLSEAYRKSEALENELRFSIIQEQKLNKLKNQFISHASHEFRTPLAVIQLSTETLKRIDPALLTEQKREQYFSQIHQSIHQITDIMDSILILGIQQSPHQLLNFQNTDMVVFIQNLLTQSFPEVERIQMTVKGRPIPYKIDAESFRRAMTNLLSNAIKYSPEDKKVEILLQYHPTNLEITVRDFGIGIPLEEQEHIFDDFYRGSNVRQIKGSGLGLSIARKIIEKHGGSLQLKCILHTYTEFTVILPRPLVED